MDIGDTEEPESHDPTLLSNVEVLELLQKNLTENQTKHKRWKHRDWVQEEVVKYLQSTPCTKLDSSRREELQLVLQSRKRRRQSSVTKASQSTTASVPDVAPEVVSSLPSSRPSPSAPPVPDAAPLSTDMRFESNPITLISSLPIYNGSRLLSERSPSISNTDASVAVGTEDLPDSDETPASGYGLTQVEALQILNFMPTEAVELHLLIEDLDSRLTQKQQDGLLETISKYIRKPPIDSLATDNGSAGILSGVLDDQRNESNGMGKLDADEQMNGH